ncbi:unnamed protein product [Chrysoparadoxa australica]
MRTLWRRGCLRARKRASFLPPSSSLLPQRAWQSTVLKPAGSDPGERRSPQLLVCFGSQTGTAQLFSEDLRDHAEDHSISAEVVDMQDLEGPSLIHHCIEEGKVLTFVIANFGKGGPTDNAKQLYKWLMDQKDADWSRLRYAIFGLGKSESYPENYQRVGRELDAHLESLGAVRVGDRGEGDDSHDMEQDFADWEGKFWNCLEMLPPILEQSSPASQQLKEEKPAPIPLHLGDILPPNLGGWDPSKTEVTYDAARPYFCPISLNKMITPPESFRQVHEIIFEPQEDALPYTTGDYMGLYARNTAQDTEELLSTLELDAAAEVAHGVQLHDYVLRCCDIMSLPRRRLVRKMAPLARDPAEAAELAGLGSDTDAGKGRYMRDIARKCLTLNQLLRQWPSVRMSPEDLINICPKIKPRLYSISSSNVLSPHTIETTIGVAEFKTPTGEMRKGQVSTYIGNLTEGDVVPCYVQASDFRLPAKDVPIIMIGVGTGIAPFKAFVEERASYGTACGATILYYGAASPHTNDLYHDMFEEAAGQGLLRLRRTYSDWPEGGTAKHRFPQELVEEDGNQLCDLIEQEGAVVYICGHKLLGDGVKAAFSRVLEKRRGVSEAEAAQVLSDLARRGIYNEDIFA